MAAEQIDDYLAKLAEPHRTTLGQLRAMIAALLPDAEQTLAYGAPAFKVGGKAVAGFTASAKHLSYLPHSGTVLAAMSAAIPSDLTWSKGALRFPVDTALPPALVAELIRTRLAEIG